MIFFKYFPMLFYAAVYEGLIPETSMFSDMIDTPVEVKINARNALFGDKEILDNFKRDNKHKALTKRGPYFSIKIFNGYFSRLYRIKANKKVFCFAGCG